MKKASIILSVAALLAICLTMAACHKNANGRNTLDLVDDATVLSLSQDEYAKFIASNPPITGTSAAEMVRRVGQRLTTATATYLAGKGQSDLIANYNWEFNLVNDSAINAWCLPGGKIVVYTGIIPVTLNDTDLAVVLGHEISHAILKHGSERMSQQLLVQYGGEALSVMTSTKPSETSALFKSAYGIGSTLSVLAFSRQQESEADETGLYIMATAGYNPNAAIGFWQRMQTLNTGTKPPVLLSTHPSDKQRIDHITELMPKAMEYYKP